MAKEKVKHLSGVFASVFAHAGHISKEDAKEIAVWRIMNLKKLMTRHPTSPIASYSMKARRWTSSWSILQRRLISASRILAENYLNRFIACHCL